MRTASMCLSILHVPRCRIHSLASIWRENFHALGNHRDNNSSFNLFGSKIYCLEGGHTKRWTRRPVTTKTEGKNRTTHSSKASNIRNEIFEGSVSTSCTVNISKTDKTQFQKLQSCEIPKVTENKEQANLVTVIVFDIETTGLSRENERIIEIAFQVLSGGKNSTFQTLVNPERYVPNSHVHGITSHMVNRPEVPRMKELIPILLQFIRSHQKPGGDIVLVAHNARCFDVPFLHKEFNRCSFEIPEHWRFVDSLPLGRESIKSSGMKSNSASLQALREHYRIPLVGSAHRAMSDVRALALILQRITFDLKLPVSGLVQASFTVSDLNKKKKN